MATLTGEWFTNGNSDFTGIPGLSGNGGTISGNNSPSGIPGALFIQNGAMVARVTDEQAFTAGAQRTEIYFNADPAGENWHTWDFMFPSAFWPGWQGAVTCGQWHDDYPGGPVGRELPFSFQYRDGVLQAVFPGCTLPADCYTYNRVGVEMLECNKWYSIAFHVKWATDGTGFREVFVNRKPVYREWNCSTTYLDANLPYLKLGVYVVTTGHIPSGDKELHVRNLRSWTGAGSYEDVLGYIPICPKPVRP